MLAARVPTAVSRQDLTRCDSDVSSEGGKPAAGYWDDVEWEVVAYAAVSFCYALGQSLYDIFQSQQAKASTTGLLNWWSGSALTSLLGPGDDAYVSAYAYAILVSAYAFAKAVSSPYVGDLSDRFGRRRVLVATLVCTGLALLLCGRAERFATVLVVRLLTGCVANGGLLTARATDVATTHAQRTRLFALFTTSWAVARVVAAAMVRLAHLGMRTACCLACLCELVAAAIAALAFYDRTADGATTPSRVRRKKRAGRKPAALPTTPGGTRVSFRSLAKSVLSERLAYSLFLTSMVTPRVDAASFVWTRFGEGPEAVGVLKALEAVAVGVVSLTPFPRMLFDRFGEVGTAVVTSVAIAFGWLAIAAAPSMAVLYCTVFARAACAAVYDPASRSLIFQRARDLEADGHKTGSLVGLQQSLKGATQVFGSWLGAYVTSLSVSLPLFVSAATSVANALVIAVECDDEPGDDEEEEVVEVSAPPSPEREKLGRDGLRRRKRAPPKTPPPVVAEAVAVGSPRTFLPEEYSYEAPPPLPPLGVSEIRAAFSERDAPRGDGPRKRARLLCYGPTVAGRGLPARSDDEASEADDDDRDGDRADRDLGAASVAAVAAWLRSRGQAFAAAQAQAAGVDGTALAIGTAEELFEALDGRVSRLVCRSILLAARSRRGAADLRAARDGGPEASTPAPALDGLSPRGRRLALEVRAAAAGPELVVVAPERAAVQAALLAFRGGVDGPHFVAHDAARRAATHATRELRLEYGDAVDFSPCDDEGGGPGDDRALDARARGRHAYALLCFVRARPETDVAVVAAEEVLEAVVHATSRRGDEPVVFAPNRACDLVVAFDATDDLEDDQPEGW